MTPTIGTRVEFFLNAVRNKIKMDADFIKIMINRGGWIHTPNDTSDDQQLSDEEIEVVLKTAHELGRAVTAHIYNSEQMQKVARMGIDGIEQDSLITKDTARLIGELGTYLVPTFCPYDDIIYLNEEPPKKKSRNFSRNSGKILSGFKKVEKSSLTVRSNMTNDKKAITITITKQSEKVRISGYISLVLAITFSSGLLQNLDIFLILRFHKYSGTFGNLEELPENDGACLTNYLSNGAALFQFLEVPIIILLIIILVFKLIATDIIRFYTVQFIKGTEDV